MTLLVLALTASIAAIAAIAYAWRIARADRLRSDARVAALAAAIDGTSQEGNATPMFERAPLFEKAGRSGLQGRPLLKLGVGFAMAVLVIVLIAMSGDRHATSADERQPVVSGQPAAPALELLSMRHTRTGDALTVTGLVRNHGAADTAPIVAVIFVFDRDGGFVASGRAPLEFGSVAVGDESPFKVTIPDVKEVGRYRVSFRTPVGIVPHVDRRATLQVSN
jgi:hypothetical protein